MAKKSKKQTALDRSKSAPDIGQPTERLSGWNVPLGTDQTPPQQFLEDSQDPGQSLPADEAGLGGGTKPKIAKGKYGQKVR